MCVFCLYVCLVGFFVVGFGVFWGFFDFFLFLKDQALVSFS